MTEVNQICCFPMLSASWILKLVKFACCTRVQPLSDFSPLAVCNMGSRWFNGLRPLLSITLLRWGRYHDLALASSGEMNSLLHLPAEHLKGSVQNRQEWKNMKKLWTHPKQNHRNRPRYNTKTLGRPKLHHQFAYAMVENWVPNNWMLNTSKWTQSTVRCILKLTHTVARRQFITFSLETLHDWCHLSSQKLSLQPQGLPQHDQWLQAPSYHTAAKNGPRHHEKIGVNKQ